MRVVSLFAGIGGFDEAFRRCGHEIVYANEWDKYAAKIYEKNFGTKPDTRDIREVPSSEIPEHDIICGGFPCQTFSIAGKRLGFSDTRGTLFREIMRIAKDCRTKYLLLENVKGLLSHDEGRTFAVILVSMDELGYDAEWQVLNSKNFGVPQNRERIFIVGHLRGEPWREVFPIGENDTITFQGKNRAEPKAQVACAITTKEGTRIENNFVIRMNDNNSKGYSEAAIGDGIRIQFPKSNTARGRVVKGNSQALQASGAGGVLLPLMKIRRLTPLECERLQGFPDGWTEGISDTQRYKCLGNAVTINVVEVIVSKFNI